MLVSERICVGRETQAEDFIWPVVASELRSNPSDCRNGGSDNTGKIVSGRISGNEIRLSVIIPADVSNCYYNGRLTSPTTIHGGYSCYQGGGLLEGGIWDVTQASAQ